MYFYEKTPIDDIAEIYVRADSVRPGADYIAVGTGDISSSAECFGADGATGICSVYSDGISYTPYTTVGLGNGFIAAKTAKGYIFEGANGNYLTSFSVTGTLSSDCVLTVDRDPIRQTESG